MNFIVIIPARFSSTRLSNKPLVDINGKPMVLHVMHCAFKSGANRVIVATDHVNVARIINAAGGEVCMTSIHHQSGTERIAEVINKYQFSDETIIVNLQVDEPMIPINIVQQVANNLERMNVNMTTLAVAIKNAKEALNPNVVKVVINSKGYALYFSRATIPWCSTEEYYIKSYNNKFIKNILLRHIGIYAYRAGFLRRYIIWKPCPLEQIELLEQLRVLWYNERIHVDIVQKLPSLSVDTIEDLERVRIEMQQNNF
ncbi:3-deoxy-manno-octulosonate cytidylyltransferase [Pantoea sp. Mhis]|uniref:3-deoxy-manno-octulosonate cytidylyltransferase n=1 Tax=Pantoea sp. Mhis TaxID=2576759 RepID=UPI001358418D|nr:3-deoxy-manno-octulosonate cytidylyltransferase [Pantoea sp. Mhis]MXP56135.1 3-deoxy-manno-octulosonate cytidylyltransferase [Pantoea sp. Mhis]